MLPNHINHLQDLHCKLYDAHQELGWTQLYYGHLSPTWVTLHYDQYLDVNGLHYNVKMQNIIWQAVLKAWHQWNQHLYLPNHNHEDKTQLWAAIYQLIDDTKHDPLLCDTVVQKEIILAQPIRQVWQWITSSNNHICNQCKAAKLRAKLCMHNTQQ